MKVAIVTQPLGPNLGGIVQNWALQQTLIELGHSPVTINYTDFEPVGIGTALRLSARNIRTLLLRPTGRYNRLYRPSDLSPNEGNLHFIRNYINTTSACDKYQPLEGAEAYIVGSDQVWRPRYNKLALEDNFLRFTDGLDVRRVAYAASFGTDHWELSDRQTAECARLLQRFDAVSVRESSAVELCRKYLGCKAVEMIDPTLLLDATHYASIAEKPQINTPYTAAYILDYDGYKRRIVQEASRLCKLADINPHRSTVPLWLGTTSGARAVVTDSFHGAVFAIIFHRPFVVIANPDRGNSRMESLLGALGLENRLVHNIIEAREALATEIDYPAVDERIAELRSSAIDFLNYSLSTRHA